MIHLVVGTKAQLIKMAAIMRILQEQGVEYNYIDTCQHPTLTEKLRTQLGIKEPNYKFIDSGKNIAKNSQGIWWMTKIFLKSLFNKKKIFKNDKGGICLVHGDTVSTILGAIMGKISGQKIVHIEAGCRTNNIFKPFPEELIRRIVDRWSEINFTFDEDSEKNLMSNKHGEIFNVHENTLVDAVNIAKLIQTNQTLPEKFILVSIHRYETIHSKQRMKFIVDTVVEFAKTNIVVWGLHEPTKNALIKFNLFEQIDFNPNIQIKGLFDYFDFINAIGKSGFLITDGGGPQDETKYLNIPCLLMRTENERPKHTHIFQSEFRKENVDYFVEKLHTFKSSYDARHLSPSNEIVKIISTYEN